VKFLTTLEKFRVFHEQQCRIFHEMYVLGHQNNHKNSGKTDFEFPKHKQRNFDPFLKKSEALYMGTLKTGMFHM
jgi:hypothetical protein